MQGCFVVAGDPVLPAAAPHARSVLHLLPWAAAFWEHFLARACCNPGSFCSCCVDPELLDWEHPCAAGVSRETQISQREGATETFLPSLGWGHEGEERLRGRFGFLITAAVFVSWI